MVGPKLIAAIAVIVVTVATIAILWFYAPKSYQESRSLSLSFQQNPPWRDSTCIPGSSPGNSNGTNVSFSWSTSSSAAVDLVIWPSGNPPGQSVYNATASSGSGWYNSQGTEWFAVFGAPGPSTVVTIDLTFTLPGHVLGGPIAGPAC